MVEDGRYEQYPWGKIAFSKLIKGMRQEFSYAKQIILKWRVVAVKPKFETFMSTIFSEYPCSNIVQSQHEMKSIVIHGSQQKPEASTSAAKVDRKFKRLENKIDSNHIDILKAIDSMANRMTGTSSQVKTDDFDQTFHVVEQQEAPTGLEVHNFANKSDPPQQNDQSNVQEDIKGPEPSTMIKQVDNISEQNISADVSELFDQQVYSDTLKEDEPSVKIQKVDDVSQHNIVADDESKILIFTPQLKDVSSHQMEPQRADTDQRIADSDTLQNTGKKDGRVADDKTDKVEEQVEEIENKKIKPSTSESNTSAPFSTETLDVIDALIYGLPLPAMPLTGVSHEQVQDECLLRDSQLLTTLPSKANILSDDAKTPFRRSRIPSKILQSPYLSNFGSSEKGKENLSAFMHQTHPFEGFDICYHPPSELVTDYSQWIDKGLLKLHGNK
ncbi:uncharacterized protein LOC129890524 [Solanum dulcamara]|uniref:uncharacterized protein LOC129890524 n=1 Tax=Solanum dulcamara TaxID=45834 RepID=UPI0024860832|nr:uncharacterized protein LOC129890524 [Solanum dulcamara]